MKQLFKDDFGETSVCESENGENLIIDVTGLDCPEYTMQFISLCKVFKKMHKKVFMKCIAPSIADIQTQNRIAYRTDLKLVSSNIDFKRDVTPVTIKRDNPIEVEFSTNS